MWPPQRLKSATPRGATPRSASLSGATSAPVLLRPLGYMPGYERSLTLLSNRHEGPERGQPTERTARLQRPRPDGFANVPPRRFPGPPHATRAAGCAFPVATIQSIGAPLLGCGASAGALLAIDQAGAAPSGPVDVAADNSSTAHKKSRAARRRWHLARDLLIVPLERKVALLKGLGFLEGCSSADLIRLAQTLRTRLLGRMRQLVRQYEHPSFFGIVLHGSVEVHDMNAGMSMLEAGECVGLEALGAHYGDYIPSLSTIITSTPCLLLVHALPAEVQKKQCQESGYAFGATLDMGPTFWASVIAGAWLDALLQRQRPHIQTRLIAALLLRMRQFSHLRFLLPLRLRLASLLSIELVPANTVLIGEGQEAETVHTFFLLQGEFAVMLSDTTQPQGYVRVGTISSREVKAHVGDLATYGDVPASATIISEGKCVCLVLRREQAAQFAEEQPEFREQAVLMANELLRTRTASSEFLQDAGRVKSRVEASKLKVGTLLEAERMELRSKYVTSYVKGSTALGPAALPPLLRFSEPTVDQTYIPPIDCDMPKELVAARRLRFKKTSRFDETIGQNASALC